MAPPMPAQMGATATNLNGGLDLKFAQQLRQLGDIRRDPPRLVLGEELGRRPPVRLIGIIDVGKLLSVRVAYDVVVRLQLGRPRGREAAVGVSGG